jgi:hypothetical protein
LCFGAAPVLAAQPAAGPAPAPAPAPEAVNPDQAYLAVVTQVMQGRREADWKTLRALYTQTSFYDPYGGAQAVWYSLQRAGQQIIYDSSPEAKQEYDLLLAQHFAHYRSHMQALEMIDRARLPAADRGMHQKALVGIVNAIVSTGNGSTPATAIHVIDPAEENYVLKTYYHYQLTGQEFQQDKGHFWDVLDYKNPATGDTGKLYFNVDEILTAPVRATPAHK